MEISVELTLTPLQDDFEPAIINFIKKLRASKLKVIELETQNNALLYIALLSIVGTGIAKTLYNKLVQISSPVFSSSVTYLIPVVAIFWGILDGEELTLLQLFAGIIVLIGVYLVNKNK